MANDLSGRQWHLDTPVPFSSGAAAILWRGNIKVAHMEWTGETSQGQQAIVKDQNGKVVWSPTCPADNSEVRTVKIGWVNGLVLDTLPAGAITVYCE